MKIQPAAMHRLKLCITGAIMVAIVCSAVAPFIQLAVRAQQKKLTMSRLARIIHDCS